MLRRRITARKRFLTFLLDTIVQRVRVFLVGAAVPAEDRKMSRGMILPPPSENALRVAVRVTDFQVGELSKPECADMHKTVRPGQGSR